MDKISHLAQQHLAELDSIPNLYRAYEDEFVEYLSDASEEFLWLGIKVDPFEDSMDLYLTFDYVDLPTGRLEELSASDIDILALNERTKLEQKYFSNFLKDHSHGFVCTWTEPTMCRGMTSRVGYRGVPSGFDEANAFIQSCKNYFESVHAMNDEELLSILVNDLVSRLGYKGGLPLKLECGSVSTVSPDTQFVSAALLQNPYLGKNYAFFQLPMPSGTVKTISAVASDAHIFQMLCQEFEYLDGADYYLLDDALIGVSRHFLWRSTYKDDPGVSYSPYLEQLDVMDRFEEFLPYADEALRNLYYNDYKRRLAFGAEINIFTEGPTDWKHMKFHWQRCREQYAFSRLDLKFLEYESENSGVSTAIHMDMDGTKLCEMCRSFSLTTNREILIFIADRDRADVVKALAPTQGSFKYWGNNVYSLVLPVPPHRVATPDICIEHLYLDEEIKSTFMCSDGVERRLYLGNEFDQYGRAPVLDRLCINRAACGARSIRVINGSTKERVLSLSTESEINYALSKMQFAGHICKGEVPISAATEKAFEALFKIILDIKIHHDNIVASSRQPQTE